MVKLFYGFDHGLRANNFILVGSNSIQDDWNELAKPKCLFHNKGVATLNQVTAPIQGPVHTAFSGGAFLNRGTSGVCLWPGKSTSTVADLYTAATPTTRSAWNTGGGAQVAFVRSLFEPSPLNADEYWFQFTAIPPNMGTVSLTSADSPSVAHGDMFRWGDVVLKFKQDTYVSGSGSTTTKDLVFSVINNNVEIATITVPGVVCGSTSTSNTRLVCSVHVRLHATLGEIEMSINGVAQSSAYANQNTVNTIAEADATAFYFTGVVTDDGTNSRQGGLDNILIDDAEFPAGVVAVRIVTLLSDASLSGAIAYGTGATTVTNALSDTSDARQLRFTSDSGRAEFNLTMPDTTGFLTDVLGFQGAVCQAANRNPLKQERVAVGVELSSLDAEDDHTKNKYHKFSDNIVPPVTSNENLFFFVPEKNGGGKFQVSDLASTTLYLRNVT
jgi:hypothetical protein